MLCSPSPWYHLRYCFSLSKSHLPPDISTVIASTGKWKVGTKMTVGACSGVGDGASNFMSNVAEERVKPEDITVPCVKTGDGRMKASAARLPATSTTAESSADVIVSEDEVGVLIFLVWNTACGS